MLGPEQTKRWEEWSVTQHIFPRQQGKEWCFPGPGDGGPLPFVCRALQLWLSCFLGPLGRLEIGKYDDIFLSLHPLEWGISLPFMVSAFAQNEAHALHAGSPAHSVLVSSLMG